MKMFFSAALFVSAAHGLISCTSSIEEKIDSTVAVSQPPRLSNNSIVDNDSVVHHPPILDLDIYLDTAHFVLSAKYLKRDFHNMFELDLFLPKIIDRVNKDGTRIRCTPGVTVKRLEELTKALKKNGIEKWSIVLI